MPNVNVAALEFQHLFDTNDDDGACDEPTNNFFEKFFQDAEHDAAVGPGHAAKLAAEIAVIDARAEGIYKGIAAKVTGATSQTLAKNSPAPATQKIMRVEVTRYPATGSEVHAEIGMDGAVIRTFAVDPK